MRFYSTFIVRWRNLIRHSIINYCSRMAKLHLHRVVRRRTLH